MEKQIEVIVNRILRDSNNISLSNGLRARKIAKAVNNLLKNDKKT